MHLVAKMGLSEKHKHTLQSPQISQGQNITNTTQNITTVIGTRSGSNRNFSRTRTSNTNTFINLYKMWIIDIIIYVGGILEHQQL